MVTLATAIASMPSTQSAKRLLPSSSIWSSNSITPKCQHFGCHLARVCAPGRDNGVVPQSTEGRRRPEKPIKDLLLTSEFDIDAHTLVGVSEFCSQFTRIG